MLGFGMRRAARRLLGGAASAAALRPLLLAPGGVTVGSGADGTVTGTSDGSTLVATVLPAGFTLNGGQRTWHYDGSGAARSASFTLIETLAGALNNPRETVASVTVEPAAAQSAPVILAILAGQSNMEGRVAREAQDVDVVGAVQFVGDASVPGYRTLSTDVTPLWGPFTSTDSSGGGWLGPGEYIARRLLADNAGAAVVLVPTFRGSTRLYATPQDWISNATAGAGGYLFENMIAQSNLAYAAAQTAYPGRPIQVRFFWVQGEFDATGGTTRAQYLAALTDLIARARARISGAAAAPFVIGSMVPESWYPTSPNKDQPHIDINAAHVDASRTLAAVLYAKGPDYVSGDRDFLHYQPAQRARDQGIAMAAALSDVARPSVTSPQTVGTSAGNKLSLALTADDPHATFELNGGAAAAQFEISDPYLAPTLRWTGDGNGPAVGSYVVKVRARDGSGNHGADRIVTCTVAAAYGQGDQGPVTATYLGQSADLNTHFGSVPVVLPAVPLGAGLNLLVLQTDGGNAGVTAVSAPGGVNGTLFQGRDDGQGAAGTVFGLIMAAAGIYDIVAQTGGGSGAVVNLRVAATVLTGTRATPATVQIKGYYGNPPFSDDGATCPAAGVVLAMGSVPAAPVTTSGGAVSLGGGNGIAVTKRASTGVTTMDGGSGLYVVTTLAFEKSV